MAVSTMCSTSASRRLFNEQGKNKLVNLIKFIDGNCLELCRGEGEGVRGGLGVEVGVPQRKQLSFSLMNLSTKTEDTFLPF